MTIEEAIKELIDASHREAKYGDTNNHYYEIMMRIEAFDMAIKALETQPCEDCISRADILDAIETWDKFGVNAEQKLIRWQDHYVPYVHLDDVRNAIANMPSVTPKGVTITDFADRCRECGKQKVGKWIDTGIGREESYGEMFVCSECNSMSYYENYCPNCGAKMEAENEKETC